MKTVSPEAVAAFCRQREVDLVLAAAPGDRSLALHAEFDGHGDFFTIVARNLEYVDLPGGFTVGELRFASSVRDVTALSGKWSGLEQRYSGPALVFRSADSNAWETADPRDLHLVVANDFAVRAGSDWKTRVEGDR